MSINILDQDTLINLNFCKETRMKVNMVDIDDLKLKKLKSGISPVHENWYSRSPGFRN